MRGKKSAALLLVLLAAVSLYGCSSPDKGSETTAQNNNRSSGITAAPEDGKGSGADTEDAAGQHGGNPHGANSAVTRDGIRPGYLPADFPIPDGASIVSSGGNAEMGKKSAIMIYETQQSMDTVGSVYKQYVKDKHLPQDTQIVDSSNVLIHGKAEGAYSYSIIGSSLPSKPGTVEVIVGWVED